MPAAVAARRRGQILVQIYVDRAGYVARGVRPAAGRGLRELEAGIEHAQTRIRQTGQQGFGIDEVTHG